MHACDPGVDAAKSGRDIAAFVNKAAVYSSLISIDANEVSLANGITPVRCGCHSSRVKIGLFVLLRCLNSAKLLHVAFHKHMRDHFKRDTLLVILSVKYPF